MLPRITVVDCGSRKVPDIVAMLARAGARPRRWPLEACDRLPAADGVVVSGGGRLFTAEPSLIDRFAFLDEMTVPILGICLGHQALAMRAGARVYLDVPRRGREEVEILAPHPLLAGLGRRPVFATDHTEGVGLPEGFCHLGRSAPYPVEVMADDSRCRFGVQFHPEISGEPGRRLFANFVSLVRANIREVYSM
jgi:GMP synthase-like glutamine amidotransferase